MDAPDTASVKFNWPALLIVVGAGLLGVIALIKQAGPVFPAKIEYETRSEYSHIRVRRSGDLRSLMFVRDDGKEVTESRVNLAHPGATGACLLSKHVCELPFPAPAEAGAHCGFGRRCDGKVP